MQLTCVVCGAGFEAQRSYAKYCGPRCNKRAQRCGLPTSPRVEQAIVREVCNALQTAGPDLVAAVVAELEAAGREGSVLGVLAVLLACQMSRSSTGAGYSALSRELRSVMTEALRDLPPSAALDELQRRRDAKCLAAKSKEKETMKGNPE